MGIKPISLKKIQLFEHPHVGRKYECCPHRNTSQCLIMIEEDCAHMREKGAFQE